METPCHAALFLWSEIVVQAPGRQTPPRSLSPGDAGVVASRQCSRRGLCFVCAARRVTARAAVMRGHIAAALLLMNLPL
ncbi:hypothetical protein AAFF_G00064090 [Aldrovandia affinis]|uniref:Uncharacterized protein n=1 Tax=Aldrovandia affinis TaxID=143900 RepID=A0AAD7T5E0_9TELE|nr:hypothetical protein AAFF_G00064090 [Aldrovandia affinis]